MEIFYNAYTKIVQNKSYYFVKRFLTFPEYENVEDILEGYGMHTDFNKACSIAGIDNLNVRKQLLAEIQHTAHQAKVIDLNTNETVFIKKIVL